MKENFLSFSIALLTQSRGSTFKIAQYFTSHGYVYVAMDVPRGRGDSDGTFEPYRHDGQDGYDAIEWFGAVMVHW